MLNPKDGFLLKNEEKSLNKDEIRQEDNFLSFLFKNKTIIDKTYLWDSPPQMGS